MPNPALSPEGSDDDDQHLDAMKIGRRLRALRTERGLTILELAAKAGISSGGISQIERGASNPSVSTLQKLRGALGVTLWSFLEGEPVEPVSETQYVRRQANRPRIVVGTNQLTKELLSPRDNNELRFMILTVPPGAESGSFLSGPGDKGGYVLSGQVGLTVGEDAFDLSEGDSFQFPSTIPHQIVNRSATEAKLVWIINIRESHL